MIHKKINNQRRLTRNSGLNNAPYYFGSNPLLICSQNVHIYHFNAVKNGRNIKIQNMLINPLK